MRPEFDIVKRTIIILGIIYALFLLGQSVWQNYSTSKMQHDFEEEIKFLTADNQRLQYLNTYYQSRTFQELEARRLLMMKKSGETMVSVSVPHPSEKPAVHQAVRAEPVKEKTLPNPVSWWLLVTGRLS